jgi:hypothetical protein
MCKNCCFPSTGISVNVEVEPCCSTESWQCIITYVEYFLIFCRLRSIVIFSFNKNGLILLWFIWWCLSPISVISNNRLWRLILICVEIKCRLNLHDGWYYLINRLARSSLPSRRNKLVCNLPPLRMSIPEACDQEKEDLV